MSKEHGDKLLNAFFPRARVIDRVESVVLRDGNDAVHVYPLSFSRVQIGLYRDHTNELAAELERADTRVQVADARIPVRINRIRSVATLPDGRLYTRSRYVGQISLANCMGKWGLPKWLAAARPTHRLTSELYSQIDQAVVHDVGYLHIPAEYALAMENVHIEPRGFTIVDIASVVGRIIG